MNDPPASAPRSPVAVLTARLVGPAPRRDLIAGLTVGALVVPQSLAYADLAGVPAVAGLYAAMVAMVAYALFGSSPYSSLGPTATSVILATAAVHAVVPSADDDPDRYAASLAALALLAGAMALAAGLARLGFLANLLSRPVLTGYTAGAALVIAGGQLAALLGISVDADARSQRLLPLLGDVLGSLDEASAVTVVLGVAGIATMLLLPRLESRVPAALVVVVASILAAQLFDLDDHGVALVGGVPSGLPGLAWPDVPAGDLGRLAAGAVPLALVAFAEVVAQGQVFAARGDRVLDPNRELVALGSANLAAGAVGGLPVSGSFSRNAVNFQAGGRTRRSGAVSAGVIALCLLAVAGVLEQLPRATLAAVVLVAILPLIRVSTFRRLARLQRDDFLLALVAAAGTVLLGILPGLAVAVLVSIGALLYRVSTTDTAVLGYIPEQDTWRSLDRHADARTAPGVTVIRFTGPLYFANASRFHHAVTEAVTEAPPGLRRLVVDARSVTHLDVTALDTLTDLHGRLGRQGVELVVAGLRGTALDTLLRSELATAVGPDHLIYPTVRQATSA